MFDARRQKACPTPPAATTASHCGIVLALGAGVPPGEIRVVLQAAGGVAAEAGFGAVPVVSRRPISDVTGPNTLTWPTAHRASMSAHGVVHWPTKTLPKPPCM